MKKLQMLFSRLLAMIFCLLFITVACAAPKPNPTPAECDAGLSWTKTGMDFGSYVGGTTGTIIMDATGAMTSSAGVVLVGGGTGVPQTFTFTNTEPGCENDQITITLPASITISNGGASTIIINNLVTNIAPKTKFKLSKNNTITIGGTLSTDPADDVGLYTGNFLVDFSY